MTGNQGEAFRGQNRKKKKRGRERNKNGQKQLKMVKTKKKQKMAKGGRLRVLAMKNSTQLHTSVQVANGSSSQVCSVEHR